MPRAKRAKAAARAACAWLDALDDALLLRIFALLGDDSGRKAGVAAAISRSGDDDDEEAWHPAHLARLACVSRCVRSRASARRSAAQDVCSSQMSLHRSGRMCDTLADRVTVRGRAPPGRRFRDLVAAHGWRAAAQHHFGPVAARLVAAAAARGSGGAASSVAHALAPAPTPPEWRALYKLLTLVPWSDVSTDLYDDAAPLCRCSAS
jgi:hypothetical protein